MLVSLQLALWTMVLHPVAVLPLLPAIMAAATTRQAALLPWQRLRQQLLPQALHRLTLPVHRLTALALRAGITADMIAVFNNVLPSSALPLRCLCRPPRRLLLVALALDLAQPTPS